MRLNLPRKHVPGPPTVAAGAASLLFAFTLTNARTLPWHDLLRKGLSNVEPVCVCAGGCGSFGVVNIL